MRMLCCRFAHCRGDKAAISSALARLDVSTSKDDISLRAEMAYGMFDTRGKVSGRECTASSMLYGVGAAINAQTMMGLMYIMG